MNATRQAMPHGGGDASTTDPEARLQRARDGDMEAFAALFEDLRPVLHRVAFRLVGRDDCDDVVMDTYLKLWTALPTFRGRTPSLKSWACKTLRNCALDALRKRDRRRVREFSADATPPDDEGLGPHERIPDPSAQSADEVASRHDQVELVRQALATLSEEHRQVLLLREADELSYREIADAAGVSIGTVMSRLFYAKRRLKTALKELEP